MTWAADSRPIQVTCYEGSRAQETPRALIVDGAEVAVRNIVDRWIEEGLDRDGRRRCFTVTGDDGAAYRIHCDYASGEWYLDRVDAA